MQLRGRLLPALTILSCCLAWAGVPRAQQPPAPAVSTQRAAQTPYQIGEHLTYAINFSSFAPAAHVELFVAGRGTYFNREGIELRAHVATVEAVRAALFAINDDYIAFIDPQTGRPFHTQVVKRTPDAPAPVTSGSLATDADINAPTITEDAAPATFDLLSAVYSLRAQPLAPGASFPVTVQQQGAQYQAELRVTGHETVKTSAGSFNALAAQVKSSAGDVNSYRLRIYFTDDARHVPVLVTARLRAGEIRAELASDEIVVPEAPPGQIAAVPTPTPTRFPTPTPTPTPAAAAGDNTPPGLPFKVGEQLSFNFFLGLGAQPLGVGNFHVRARGRYFNRDAMIFSATLFTSQAGQRLFPVSDKIESYVDAASLLPFRTELQVQEGRHRTAGIVTMDQERGTALATDGKPIEIPVGTYDWVAALYALRSFDLTPPKRNAVSLLINKRPRTLFINAVKRETIELGGQRIPAVQLALATDDPGGDQLSLRLWVSLDKRRLPLRITATTPVGIIRGDLSIIPVSQQ